MTISFSVLIPVYNNDTPEKFFKAMESIFANSLMPEKVIVVQDGPVCQQLLNVIEHFKSSGILLHLRNDVNLGLTASLNKGLKNITSEYTFRADSDDVNISNRFEAQIELLKTGLDVVGAQIVEVDENGIQLGHRLVPCSHEEIKKYVKFRNPINHMTVAFRTDVVRDVGGYPDLPFREDYGLWAILISKGYKFKNSKEILVEVSGGKQMFERRGGVKNILSDFRLQLLLWRLGINNLITMILVFFGRSLIFGFPNRLRAVFYLVFLRKQKA